MGEHEKSELDQAAQLAIELNEPEAYLASLQRAAGKKAQAAHLSEGERARWRTVAGAIDNALKGIQPADAPQSAGEGEQTA
jgi:hypothetical protein